MSKPRYLSFGTIVGLWPGSILLAFATLGIPAGSAEENSSPTAVLRSASSDPALVGEMAGFKSLVDQIKVTFEEGQIIAAKTKVGELESLWEQAEPRLYLTYPKQSQMLDQSIDRLIALFSQSNPDPAQARASLHQLTAILSHPIHQTVELQEKVPAVNWDANDWYAPPRSPAFNDLFGS